jgi:putative thioredoxin
MENIVNITLENFQEIILAGSQEKLIMVDFWAEWSEPCKSLVPLLEKIACEYPNELILGKVNCDEQQEISMQFGVRDLPTVILVKDGQPIDGFAGVQSESEIRTFLEKHLPKPEDNLFNQAQEFMAQEDAQSAFPLAKQAFGLSPERADIKLLLADIYLSLARLEQAKELLDSIKLVDQNSDYHSLLGKLALAEEAATSPELIALQKQVEENPEDLENCVLLAIQLHQANRSEEALAILFKVLNKDLNFGDAKKTTLDIINALPDGDPLASQYRRKVYSLLY